MGQHSCPCTCCRPSRTKRYYFPSNNNASFENNIKNRLLKKDKEENPYINQTFNYNNKINDLENIDRKINLIIRTYYTDSKEKEEYIMIYRVFVTELNHQMNILKDQLNIAIFHKKISENLLSKEEKNSFINDIEIISIKVIEMESLLEKQKIELKNLESYYKIIQEQIYEIKKNEKNELTIKFLIFH